MLSGEWTMAVIEKVNPMPLYLQLKNQIKKEIRTGLLKAGDKLPSEAQLQMLQIQTCLDCQ